MNGRDEHIQMINQLGVAMRIDKQSTDVLKDKRPVPQLIRHRWSSTEMANLGELISNIGHTISASAGRLHRWEHEGNAVEPTNNESERLGINMRSASAWNDSVELLCSLSWHMRNKVNKKIGLNQGGASEDVLDTLQTQLVVLVDAKKNSPDPETATFLQGKIVEMRERIDATIKATQSGDSFDYFTPIKTDFRASLNENDDIDSLKAFFGEDTDDFSFMFGDVGKTKLTKAIDQLKAANVLKIYQLLNMPKAEVEKIVGKSEETDAGKLQPAEVLKEVLHSYGFKRRTDGNPRFDLPVGRFPFSQAAYRTRSERRAGTALSKGRGDTPSFIASEMRKCIEGILSDAHRVAGAAEKRKHIFGDADLERWFTHVEYLLADFKGIIPERLWHVNIKEQLGLDAEGQIIFGSYNKYISRLSDAIGGSMDQEKSIKGGSIIDAELTTTYSNNLIYENRYYMMSNQPVEPTHADSPLDCCGLVQVVTHIIFEWIKSVEMNVLLQRVVPEEGWLCFDENKKEQPKRWVWNRSLLKKGFKPLAWELQEIGPKGEGYFEFAAPKVLGPHLEYEKA